MKDIHCTNCGRFLCKLAFGEIEIKCRCKTVNKVRVDSYKALLTGKLEGNSIKA